MPKEPTVTAEQLVQQLRRRHPGLCRHWFDAIRVLGVDNGVLRLLVPAPVQLRYLQSRCVEPFTEATQELTGRLLTVQFVGSVDEVVRSATDRVTPDDPVDAFGESTLLLPDNTFDAFVVGPTNRLAHAGALAVADQPGQAYNPFFVHGGVGLGKTHLLQAITRRIVEREPTTRFCYVSCEAFIERYTTAVRLGRVDEFRRLFRGVDVLIIDDIHFLSRHEQSQEEFFHTFNALHQAQRQVVLSSDASPADIPELEERLVSRFKSGLVAPIEKPCFETRKRILATKAQLRGVELPDDVLTLVATRVDTNIRELEGVLSTMQGIAEAERTEIDLDVARTAVGEEPERTAERPTVQRIVDVTVQFYGIRLSDLLSKRRSRSIALPRQIAMWIARRHTHLSLGEIGGYFGGRDHSTVLHACRTIEKRRHVESSLQDDLERLERILGPGPEGALRQIELRGAEAGVIADDAGIA